MEPKAAIRFVFLDIGGVLLSDGWPREARRRAAAHFDIDFADFEDRHQAMWDLLQRDACTLDDYMAGTVFHIQRPFTPDQFRDFIYAQSRPYPAMLDLVRRLKAANDLKILAVSNEGRELNAYRIAQFGLNDIFDAYVSSCYIHLMKPDPGFFRLALDIAQALPEQTVYVENTALLAEVAAGLGIHTILHTDAEATRAAFAAFGLVLNGKKDDGTA